MTPQVAKNSDVAQSNPGSMTVPHEVQKASNASAPGVSAIPRRGQKGFGVGGGWGGGGGDEYID